jgi:hypothetical protein
MVQQLVRVADPGRYRQAGEEAQRVEEKLGFATNQDAQLTPLFPLTRADSKLAMSFRMATAAAAIG